MSDSSMSNPPEQYNHTESVVVDTRPLVVWVGGEDGDSTVEEFLSDLSYNHIDMHISRINLIETFYTFESIGLDAEEITTHVRDMGLSIVEAEEVWKRVARFKNKYTPNFPLGDAFALATSVEKDLPLLGGDETHWEEPRQDGYDIRLLSEF
jgi:PIN domain nuclease of toxin-antitoxin system